MIINRTAYNSPVVVTLPAAPAPPRFPSQARAKELKSAPETAEILNVSGIAALMRISPATAREMCKRGEIPARKILKRYYIARSALLRFLEGKGRECQQLKQGKEGGETPILYDSTTAGGGLKFASR